MENVLSLKEKFILLCYHPEKGKPFWNLKFYIYGIVGAIFLELAGLQKIKVTNKRLEITDSKKSGDQVLDLVLDVLLQSKRQKKVQTWIQRFSSFRMGRKIKRMILDGLVEKRILGKEEAKFLFFFKYFKYPARETRTRNELIKNVQDFVLRNRSDEPDALMLSSLVGSAQIKSRIFDKADRKVAGKRLKEIIKGNEVSQIVGETVAAVQAAVVASVTASAAASAAARG